MLHSQTGNPTSHSQNEIALSNMAQSSANTAKAKDDMMVCEVLRLLRVIRDMSGRQLAESMGVSPSYICDVESKRKRPSLEMLKRYSEALGVSMSSILYFSEEFEGKNYKHEELLLKILEAMVSRRQRGC